MQPRQDIAMNVNRFVETLCELQIFLPHMDYSGDTYKIKSKRNLKKKGIVGKRTPVLRIPSFLDFVNPSSLHATLTNDTARQLTT